ncbi:MAG TPA: Gfo/Idh/MocA family oxidoreductase [Cyclobacteriaceae bacterium]
MKFISDEVKWGIVGCGDVCEVKSGPAFNKVGHSRLVAVMRRDRARAEDYARRHGVPRFYDNADQLISDDEVNAIYIATPPVYHEEYAYRALKAGKPVYIEKPITLNSASCERMIAAADQYDRPAVCAHYRRELPLYKRVRSIIREGQLGNVRFVDLQMLKSPPEDGMHGSGTNWRVDPAVSGGGLFYDLAPHQLDILYWIFGSPLETSGRSLNQSGAHDAPDITYMEALFENKILLHGLWAFNVGRSAQHDSCKIAGDRGFISFPFFIDPVLDIYTVDLTRQEKFTNPPHIQQPMIEAVVRYFRGEGENPCSLREALVSMRMMDAAG